MNPADDDIYEMPEDRQCKVTLAMFLRWLDEASTVKINWEKCHPELRDTPLSNARYLADILHTAIDGFQYNEDGYKILEFVLDEEVFDEIYSGLEHYELIRSGLSRDLVGAGHGELSDFNHLLKLYLIAKKKIKPPTHFKKFIRLPIFTDRVTWLANRIDDIVLKLHNAKLDQPIKSIFKTDIKTSESGKGASKKDIRYVPEFMDKAVKSIIEKGQGKNQAMRYSGVERSSFNRDWERYKFIALKEYILDLTHWGFINGDDRVKQKKYKSKYQDINGNPVTEDCYKIEITLPAAQHKKIESLWGLKKLPNPIIVKGFNTSKELYVEESE